MSFESDRSQPEITQEAGQSAWEPTAPGSLRVTFARVAPASFLVQILSFGSSVVLATQLGPTSGTDAYYLALSVPALVYAVLLAAIRLGGVPALTEVAHRGDKQAFDRACRELITGTFVVAAALSFVAMGIMIVALPAVAGASAEVTKLTREYIAELWPYAVSGAMIGVLGTILGVRGRFAISALVLGIEPLVKSILVLVFGRQLGAEALVIGNVAGNLLAAAILWAVLSRDGVTLGFAGFWSSPLVRGVLKVSAPLVISQSVIQFNPLIDRTLAASLGTGNVTVFQLGVSLFTAPATVIAATIAAPLAATWSARYVREGWERVTASFRKVVGVVIAILPPVAALGTLLSRQLVSLVYSSHAYPPSAIDRTATVLSWLTVGLVSQILITPLATLFVIRRYTVFPMMMGIANFVLNAALDLLLRGPLGVGGIALSTSFTLTVLCLAYGFEAQRRWGSGPLWTDLRRPVFVGLGVSGVIALGGTATLNALGGGTSRPTDVLAIAFVTAIGAVAECGALALSGIGSEASGQAMPAWVRKVVARSPGR